MIGIKSLRLPRVGYENDNDRPCSIFSIGWDHLSSERTPGVRELIWAGKIPVVREEGARKMFLDVRDLDEFIQKNKSVYL